MLTFAEYHRTKMQDPAFKREYDALEGWYQEELAKIVTTTKGGIRYADLCRISQN